MLGCSGQQPQVTSQLTVPEPPGLSKFLRKTPAPAPPAWPRTQAGADTPRQSLGDRPTAAWGASRLWQMLGRVQGGLGLPSLRTPAVPDGAGRPVRTRADATSAPRRCPDGHFASSSDGSRCRSAGDAGEGVGEGGATQVAFEHARTRCSARTGESKDAGRRRSCVQVASPEFRDTDDTGGKEALAAPPVPGRRARGKCDTANAP